LTLFQFYFAEFSAIYILLAWAVYLTFRINQLYLGPLYSMCLGAYFGAYAALNWGWPFWLIFIGAVGLSLLFSLIPSFRFARLGAFAIVIATMALLFMVQTVIRNWEALGGARGLFNIPHIPRQIWLGVTYGFVLIIGFCVYRLDHSHIGRAMDAVHFDRDVAATLGIDVSRLSIQLQLFSSAIGGIAGVLYVFTLGSVFPDAFGFFLLMYVITIVVFGGMYTMWGIIIASPVLWGVGQFLPAGLVGFSVIVFNVLLIGVLLIRPSGMINRKSVRAITNGCKDLLQRFTDFHK